MAISVMESGVFGGLFGDAAIAALFSDQAEIAAMLRFEAALARVEARLGAIPAAAGEAISAAVKSFHPDIQAIREGTVSAGVPVPALVSALRKHVGGEHGPYAHWGATTQDVMDTGLVLRLRDALAILESRLDAAISALAEQATAQAGTPMAARTRAQIATPTSFGLRIAGWLAPLERSRERLEQLKPRLLMVQLGGASGTLAALDGKGVAVMEALAEELGLKAPAKPWHAERDGIAELAGWLSLVTGALGKMGGDLILLGRSEIGEAKAGAGGGSSTMPQKANPVGAETLVALARFNAGQVGLAHQALQHAEERDSSAWSLEWMTLPQMMAATGAALSLAKRLASSLTADEQRMRDNLALGGGAALAEAAAFALAGHMPLPQAQALVKQAIAEAAGGPFLERLKALSDAPVDWDAFADPARHVGEAAALIERVLSQTAGRGDA